MKWEKFRKHADLLGDEHKINALRQRQRETKEFFAPLDAKAEKMSPWERDFTESVKQTCLKKGMARLSPKQKAKIMDIKNKIST